DGFTMRTRSPLTARTSRTRLIASPPRLTSAPRAVAVPDSTTPAIAVNPTPRSLVQMPESPSPYEAMAPSSTLAHVDGAVTLVEGRTFCLSGRTGDINPD